MWGCLIFLGSMSFKTNGRENSNVHSFLPDLHNNSSTFLKFFGTLSTINIYYSDLRKYMDWSLNLATIMSCFPFKWLCRPLVEPFVTLNKAEQCRHLAWESIRLSRKWVHTFDLVVSEMSSNSPSPSPPGFNNWKYFLGPKKQIWKSFNNSCLIKYG